MMALTRNHVVRIATSRRIVTGVALLSVAVLILILLAQAMHASAIMRGWLVAFVLSSSVPVGSMLWLMIHRLTGGAWGYASASVLRPAATMMPLLLIGFVPVIVGLNQIYPWTTDPAAMPADVVRWYLNGSLFSARSVIAILGWSVLAMMFALTSGTELLAGLGLAFFGLTINLLAVDWILSLDPPYVSTAFAATIAIQQLLIALAFAALFGPATDDERTCGDIGGLLIAGLLGVTYLEFMTFVIAWYGDLPEKASWYLRRDSVTWIAVLLAAVTTGGLVPFAMLVVKRVRQSRSGLRIAGGFIIVGSALHLAWLTIPSFENSLAVSIAAIVSLGVLGLIVRLIAPTLSRLTEAPYDR
jgi:hypothetical protein